MNTEEKEMKCIPNIPHVKPCGPVPAGGEERYDDDDECTCGCTPYGDYCMEPNNSGC